MTTKCEAIKVKYTAASECERPQSDETGHHYEFLEYRPGERINAFLWALVADESPASSPTDAEIERRVDLLIQSCNETIVRDPSTTDFGAIQWGKFYIVVTRKDCRVWADTTEDVFMHELRRVAIRQLLAERGGK